MNKLVRRWALLATVAVFGSGTTIGCGPNNSGGECAVDIDCADGDACTRNICDNGTCKSELRTDIDDGDECTVDTCDPITGPAHTPVDIDDGIGCTVDACDSATGVVSHTPSADLCTDSDGAACTVPACDPEDASSDPVTGCVEPADDSVCDDSYSCTADVCNPADGAADADGCVITAQHAMCDDAVGCTQDACVGDGGDSEGCANTPNHASCSETDGFSCTVPTCDLVNDCTEAPNHAACDDSVGCTDNTCIGAGGDANGCTFVANNANCADVDGFSCTVPTCDPVTDCSEIVSDAVCNDGVGCTTDACVGAGGDAAGCSNVEVDSVCAAGQFCSAATDCGAVISGEQNGDIIITELRILGPTASELVELRNTTGADLDIAGFLLQNGAGAFADVRATTDLDGSAGTAVIVPAGGSIYGIANPASGVVPPGAIFVYGVPGDTFELADTGDVLAVYTSAGALEDVVDFSNLVSDPAAAVAAGAFPASLTATTQLDPTALDAEANDNGDAWCTTFYSATVRSRVADTAGADNGSCSALVINEVLYDFDHPTLGGNDPDRVFIEIAGPGGAQLTGWQVRGVGPDGSLGQPPNLTLGSGPTAPARMPVDGLLVIADGDGNDGTTFVPNADVIVGNGDPQNGPDGIHLRDPTGNLVDALAYGEQGGNVSGEGTPAPNVALADVAISLARNETSDDTDDNATDFHLDPTPSPGEQNAPVIPQIVSVTPDDHLAAVTGTVTIVTVDFGSHANVNGSAVADRRADATYISQTTNENCTIIDATDDGRGQVTWSCPVPANGGVVERGDFTFTNPALLGGGSATLPAGWTYTGVLNETDATAEADFCNLQFPTSTTVTQGQSSALIYGRIFETGVTEAPGADGSILAELGLGPAGSNPATDTGWSFNPATFNVQVGNDDEYEATLVGPAVSVPTDFAYTYRFSFDGGLNYTYCDLDGAGSNPGLSLQSNQLGTLTVNP